MQGSSSGMVALAPFYSGSVCIIFYRSQSRKTILEALCPNSHKDLLSHSLLVIGLRIYRISKCARLYHQGSWET